MLQAGDVKVTFAAKIVDSCHKKKISQEATFTVFLPEKLLKLFCIAGMESDEDLKDAISTISDKCKICEIDHRPRFKPVVSVSL